MTKLQQLFSFAGRTSRLAFWRAQIGLLLVMALFWCGGLLLADLTGLGGLSAIALAGCGFLYWPALALYARRLHDRNKSIWWIVPLQAAPLAVSLAGPGQLRAAGGLVAGLLGLADIVLLLWGFVEIGLLPGTAGPNRYGADPRAA